MEWQVTPYIIPPILATIILVLSAQYVWSHKTPLPGSKAGASLLLAAAVWMFFGALAVAGADLPTKFVWEKAQYLGIVAVPTAWFIFICQFTGREKWVTRRTLCLLSIVPFITLLLVFTNEAHNLIWTDVALDTSGSFAPLETTYGLGFWAFIAYAYALVFVAVLLLVQLLARSRRLYRWQGSAMLVTVLIPWLLSALDALNVQFLGGLDPTVVGVAVTGPLLAWNLRRLRLGDMVPVARETTIEGMSDGVIVLDEQSRILDMNSASEAILGCRLKEVFGQPAAKVWPGCARQLQLTGNSRQPATELILDVADGQSVYDLRVSTLADWRGRLNGYVMSLRDISERKQLKQERALRQAMAAISSSLDLPQVLTRIAQQVANSIDATSAYITSCDQVTETSTVLAEYIGPKACAEEQVSDLGYIYEEADSEFWSAMQANECCIDHVDDPELPDTERAMMLRYGAQSILYIPLWIREQLIGYVEVWDSRRRREFTHEEIALCQGIAQSAAIALENARLYEEAQQELVERKRAEAALQRARDQLEVRVEERTSELRIAIEELEREITERQRAEKEALRRSEELTTLNAIAMSVTSTLDLQEALRIIQERVQTLLGEKYPPVFGLFDEAKRSFMVVMSDNHSTMLERAEKALGVRLDWHQFPLSVLDSAAREAIHAGRVYVTADVSHLLRSGVGGRLLQTAQRAMGIKCIADMPLMVKGKLVGTMVLPSQKERILDKDMELLSSIASHAAIAIENAQLFEETKRLAATDPLTGLWNRHHVEERRRVEELRAHRHGHPLSTLMIDIDKLKLFNDTYGHPEGDQLLRSVAELLLDSCRETDILGRYAGDEFAIILPETDSLGAIMMAQRIMAALEQLPFRVSTGIDVPISVSIGIASYPTDTREVERLFPLADASMYRAKLAGGGQFASVRDQLAQGHPEWAATFDALQGLLITVDAKDHYTFKHCQEVTEGALALARAVGLSHEDIGALEIAGKLHDVGKISIPTEVLSKPGALTSEEWKIIREHPRLGQMLLRPVAQTEAVLQGVLHHHEHYDGTGYPNGLSGEEIPLPARILAVADAFSAMIADRPYRKGLSIEKALDELRCNAGRQFDPDLAAEFSELIEQGEYVPLRLPLLEPPAELNIYSWAEYFPETVVSNFEEEYGFRLNLHTYADEEEALVVLQSNPSSYDLVMVSDSLVYALARVRALAPLGHSNLPNLANLYHRFTEPRWDPGLKYSVPLTCNTTGLAVNRRFVTEEVTGWGVLFDPRFEGRVAMLNNVWEIMVAALKYQGQSINTADPDAIHSAAKLLRQQMPLIVGYMNPLDIRDSLISGNLWVAQLYSGEASQAIARNPDLEYIIPEEGTSFSVEGFVIPAKSPHKSSAEVFLNYLLRPEVSGAIANYLRESSTNQGAEPYIAEDILSNPAIYPGAEVWHRLEAWNEDLSMVSAFETVWDELRAELESQKSHSRGAFSLPEQPARAALVLHQEDDPAIVLPATGA